MAVDAQFKDSVLATLRTLNTVDSLKSFKEKDLHNFIKKTAQGKPQEGWIRSAFHDTCCSELSLAADDIFAEPTLSTMSVKGFEEFHRRKSSYFEGAARVLQLQESKVAELRQQIDSLAREIRAKIEEREATLLQATNSISSEESAYKEKTAVIEQQKYLHALLGHPFYGTLAISAVFGLTAVSRFFCPWQLFLPFTLCVLLYNVFAAFKHESVPIGGPEYLTVCSVSLVFRFIWRVFGALPLLCCFVLLVLHEQVSSRVVRSAIYLMRHRKWSSISLRTNLRIFDDYLKRPNFVLSIYAVTMCTLEVLLPSFAPIPLTVIMYSALTLVSVHCEFGWQLHLLVLQLMLMLVGLLAAVSWPYIEIFFLLAAMFGSEYAIAYDFTNQYKMDSVLAIVLPLKAVCVFASYFSAFWLRVTLCALVFVTFLVAAIATKKWHILPFSLPGCAAALFSPVIWPYLHQLAPLVSLPIGAFFVAVVAVHTIEQCEVFASNYDKNEEHGKMIDLIVESAVWISVVALAIFGILANTLTVGVLIGMLLVLSLTVFYAGLAAAEPLPVIIPFFAGVVVYAHVAWALSEVFSVLFSIVMVVAAVLAAAYYTQNNVVLKSFNNEALPFYYTKANSLISLLSFGSFREPKRVE